MTSLKVTKMILKRTGSLVNNSYNFSKKSTIQTDNKGHQDN